MRRILVPLVSLSSLTLLVGCQNKLHDENLALIKQNRELQDELALKNATLKSMPDPAMTQEQFAKYQADLAAKDSQIKELQDKLRQGDAGAGSTDPNLAGIETSYDRVAGTITVTLPGDVLFASGSADLKDSAQATLGKLVAALKGKDYAGKKLLVQGFTDSDPISKTKDQWIDNLDLSLCRAAAVTRYLRQHGIDPRQITTSGFGEYRTKPGAKAKSRRVEIVVIPK